MILIHFSRWKLGLIRLRAGIYDQNGHLLACAAVFTRDFLLFTSTAAADGAIDAVD